MCERVLCVLKDAVCGTMKCRYVYSTGGVCEYVCVGGCVMECVWSVCWSVCVREDAVCGTMKYRYVYSTGREGVC